ncbi:hypothetical protein Peur_023586 [Populus x canadensis]
MTSKSNFNSLKLPIPVIACGASSGEATVCAWKALVTDRKENCEVPGSACYDPRFIGGDGIVFFFHGKSNEHFSLVSDFDLQINSRFIGHRPASRDWDFTWIQALGILFNSQTFSL